jgi:hypothetical protein
MLSFNEMLVVKEKEREGGILRLPHTRGGWVRLRSGATVAQVCARRSD